MSPLNKVAYLRPSRLLYVLQHACFLGNFLNSSEQRCLRNGKVTTSNKYYLPSKARSTTAVDPRHKSQRVRYHSLTKSYCFTISIQKISPIHEFLLKIQQILGSHELKEHDHFWPRSPKNH